ncbi:MAG: hypothetical protein KDD36_13350 [Flavobacteriales bacterium]|nr:hypothetical protein [Flavobacteriales bacterium]
MDLIGCSYVFAKLYIHLVVMEFYRLHWVYKYFGLASVMCIVASTTAFAQNDQALAEGSKDDAINMEDLVNTSTHFPDGIRTYENLNLRLGGDSVRYCDGKLCNGWVEDRHLNGSLKHKGYYENGQLVNLYFNYYESGQLEREYRSKDDFRSTLVSYYPNGQVRSKVTYKDGDALEWEDYYPNGKLEYQEVNHKSFEYQIINKYFYESGLPQTEMVLVDKKHKIFDKREYFENGKVKMEGKVRYSMNTLDYVKIETWKEYDESGKLILEQSYDNEGGLKKETKH